MVHLPNIRSTQNTKNAPKTYRKVLTTPNLPAQSCQYSEFPSNTRLSLCLLTLLGSQGIVVIFTVAILLVRLRWFETVFHFPFQLNFMKGLLACSKRLLLLVDS